MGTQDLIGAELDAAASKALGLNHIVLPFSTDWGQGGQIIERERITVIAHEGAPDERWSAMVGEFTYYIDKSLPAGFGNGPEARGPTPLIAAMRAFVASKQ